LNEGDKKFETLVSPAAPMRPDGSPWKNNAHAETSARRNRHRDIGARKRWSARASASLAIRPAHGTVDDPTDSFPNPTLGASAPTVFSSLSGSSTATHGTFTTPVAAIRLMMNALSSAGGKVTATILQAGSG
jgi:hypothetical protein